MQTIGEVVDRLLKEGATPENANMIVIALLEVASAIRSLNSSVREAAELAHADAENLASVLSQQEG